MIVLVGDKVRTRSGYTGTITETWGRAQSFYRIRLDDGRTIPIIGTDVVEIIQRKGKRFTSKVSMKGGECIEQ